MAERVRGINWKTLAVLIGGGLILWQVLGKFLKFPTPVDLMKETADVITTVVTSPKRLGEIIWDRTHPGYHEKKTWELLGTKSRDFLATAPWREDPKGLTQDMIAFLEKERADQIKAGNISGDPAVLPIPPGVSPSLSTSEAKEAWAKLGPGTRECLRTACWRDKEAPQHHVDFMEAQRASFMKAGLI